MKQLVLLSFLTLFTVSIKAQSHHLKGVVKDKKGIPVPFASIFETNTNKGTSANGEGAFTFTLPSGTHEIVATAVGFKPKTVLVTLNQDDSVRIELEKESYTLQEVVIGNQEDPAYAIIRKAIKSGPITLNNRGPIPRMYTSKGCNAY